ncbi:VIT1/CCC1 transporter family protein [Candidatus Woesearchaeota archaeon]|nr:VIT1/CCC1 transporter family protein [Candidatus Woesearchaeota archaeon]
MKKEVIDSKVLSLLLSAQKSELTEYNIYDKLAKTEKNKGNKKILEKISKDEIKHHDIWKKYTNKDVRPNKIKIWFYYIFSKLLGLTFGVKLMERGEEFSQKSYKKIAKYIPNARKIEKDEHKHEKQLLSMINEKKLSYIGSIVLGLNDALVELTAALTGLTLALQNTRLIAITGLITGIAASFSMAASEYLSTKSEPGNEKHPVRAAVYTGITYIVTVFILVLPYFMVSNIFLALTLTVSSAILIIFLFTFYSSIAKDIPFKKRFFEMVFLSLGIALLTFLIGLLVRKFFSINV